MIKMDFLRSGIKALNRYIANISILKGIAINNAIVCQNSNPYVKLATHQIILVSCPKISPKSNCISIL
jgi:hypothetical protein